MKYDICPLCNREVRRPDVAIDESGRLVWIGKDCIGQVETTRQTGYVLTDGRRVWAYRYAPSEVHAKRDERLKEYKPSGHSHGIPF